MPVQTTIEQDCNTYTNSAGALKFYVRTTVTLVKPGDLPFPEIFVFKVTLPNDPKADVFQRVAQIPDLGSISIGRDAAVAAGQGLYLAHTFQVDFDDVLTGTAGKQTIQARIDALITDWITYTTQFTTPSTITLPPVDPDIVAAAKTAYTAAVANQTTKENALSNAATALAAAQAAADNASAALVDAAAASILCTQNLAVLSTGVTAAFATKDAAKSLLTAVDTLVNAVNVYQSEHTGTGPYTVDAAAYNIFVTALNAFTGALEGTGGYRSSIVTGEQNMGALTAAQAAITTECSNAQTAVTTKGTAKVAADTALGAAQTAKAQAQADADTATAAVSSALAAVQAVCPDFVG